ncbi:MAG: T9SS type A sorting domain-containing protein [Bacteroidetes bacterium]|nr:T9SS type A sorting domain-containing protein [Bacteroidota bacterium]
MKKFTTFLRNNTAVIVSVLAVVLVTATGITIAQNKSNGPVKVKIVKIVDGDTITIEKTMDEASVKDFTKQFENINGKNVQVMITVEDVNKDEKNKSAQSMHFNFDMDSTTSKAFAKAFVFSGDSLKELNFDDSIFKSIPKNFKFDLNFDDKGIMNDFDFDINTDDNGKVIIKSGKEKTIVINGDKDNTSISKSENNSGKSKSKTIVINDDKGKKKKMIVTTSVVVMDMDDDKSDDVYKSNRKKSKDETEFSFYPNPSDGNFILELNLDEKEPAQIKITDMDGKEMYNEKLSGNGMVSKTINLNGKKGTFIVTIRQGKKITSKKIIIE